MATSTPKREADIHGCQVVLAGSRTVNAWPVLSVAAPVARRSTAYRTGMSGRRRGHASKSSTVPCTTTVRRTPARTHFHDVIGGLIVSSSCSTTTTVSPILRRRSGWRSSSHVALLDAGRYWLVQDVQHPSGPIQSGRQPDPLRLAARQSARTAVEGDSQADTSSSSRRPRISFSIMTAGRPLRGPPV